MCICFHSTSYWKLSEEGEPCAIYHSISCCYFFHGHSLSFHSTSHHPQYSFIKIFVSSSHRGFDPVLRWQHVHEGRDAKCHAHWSGGRLPPLHVPAGVRPPHGRHVAWVSRHIEVGAGQWKGQTDGQPRYCINRPCWLTSCRVEGEA